MFKHPDSGVDVGGEGREAGGGRSNPGRSGGLPEARADRYNRHFRDGIGKAR